MRNESCCESKPVEGGIFYRDYDVAEDGMHSEMTHPATISDFRLDTYEVTVERFRRFVELGPSTQEDAPKAGSGGHLRIQNSGWDSAWNMYLPSSRDELTKSLHCDTERATWTDQPSANELNPINCVTWYVAMAFCIWDGGYLPTNAEWNYAAAGGSEQRTYPWSAPPSSATINCTNASYVDQPDGKCFGLTSDAVGSSPAGNARWGHADMAASLGEWVLDWSSGLSNPMYIEPCDDCAQVDQVPNYYHRVVRGGDFQSTADLLRVAYSVPALPNFGNYLVGFRCARPGH